MSEVKQPTCGRMVHWFPNVDNPECHNGPFPAIVQDNDNYPTLTIITGDSGTPVMVVLSVPHQTVKVEGKGYWAWPEIK